MKTADGRQDMAARPMFADPDREMRFRRWQAAWRRRIAFSRRLAPLDNGMVDPVAPSGRWLA